MTDIDRKFAALAWTSSWGDQEFKGSAHYAAAFAPDASEALAGCGPGNSQTRWAEVMG